VGSKNRSPISSPKREAAPPYNGTVISGRYRRVCSKEAAILAKTPDDIPPVENRSLRGFAEFPIDRHECRPLSFRPH